MVSLMKNFFALLKNPLLWPFYLFGPVAYGGGNGIIILLAFLGIGLYFYNCSLTEASFQKLVASFRALPLPLFILFCLWEYLTISSFWAPHPLSAFGTSLRLFCLLILTSTLLFQLQKLPITLLKKCLSSFVWSWTTLIILLFLSIILNGTNKTFFWIKDFNLLLKPSQITRPALLASLFFWPSCAFIVFYSNQLFFQNRSPLFREISFLTLGLGIVLITFFLNMNAASLGLFLGLIIYLFLKKYPTFFSPLLNTLVGLGFIFPFCTKFILHFFIFLTSYKTSYTHRLIIWDFTSDYIKQFPYFGWGLEAARFLPSSTVKLFLPKKEIFLSLNTLPLHPHNAFLQIWLEGGVFAAFLLACFLCSLIVIIKKNFSDPKDRALLAGVFLNFLVPFYVSFGIWQTWWLSTLCFVTILWISLKRYNKIK